MTDRDIASDRTATRQVPGDRRDDNGGDHSAVADDRTRRVDAVAESIERRDDVDDLRVVGLSHRTAVTEITLRLDVVSNGSDADGDESRSTTGRSDDSRDREPAIDWSGAAVPAATVEAAIEASDSVPELAAELGVSTDRTLWLLGKYDLDSAIFGPEAGADRPSGEPPGSLTAADVVAVAERTETLAQVAADFEVDAARALAVLEAHDCADEVVR